MAEELVIQGQNPDPETIQVGAGKAHRGKASGRHSPVNKKRASLEDCGPSAKRKALAATAPLESSTKELEKASSSTLSTETSSQGTEIRAYQEAIKKCEDAESENRSFAKTIYDEDPPSSGFDQGIRVTARLLGANPEQMPSKDCFVAFAANAASMSVLDHVNGLAQALEQSDYSFLIETALGSDKSILMTAKQVQEDLLPIFGPLDDLADYCSSLCKKLPRVYATIKQLGLYLHLPKARDAYNDDHMSAHDGKSHEGETIMMAMTPQIYKEDVDGNVVTLRRASVWVLGHPVSGWLNH